MVDLENELGIKIVESEFVEPGTVYITKRFNLLQCRACSGKMIPSVVCLDCREPTRLWCENCTKLEDFEHKGHTLLRL